MNYYKSLVLYFSTYLKIYKYSIWMKGPCYRFILFFFLFECTHFFIYFKTEFILIKLNISILEALALITVSAEVWYYSGTLKVLVYKYKKNNCFGYTIDPDCNWIYWEECCCSLAVWLRPTVSPAGESSRFLDFSNTYFNFSGT